jgi:hypothetical protein
MSNSPPRALLTSPRLRGEVELLLAMRSIVQRNSGEGDSPRVSPPIEPLTPTLSPQAGEGETQLRVPAARMRPSYSTKPSKEEGAGNAGCSLHPQPRTQSKKAHECSHHRYAETFRHSPLNGFNGFLRDLPGDRAFLPPSLAAFAANLMPASGHQDHTTSPSAFAPFVKGAIRVHRIPPRVRDDREPPLL